MWKTSEKPKTILASRSLIDEFVNMEPAPHDRPLSERRLQVYERILKAGDFRPVTWASVLCHETNCTYRVNGKHTSILLSKLDPIPTFYVTVERYECATLTDVGKLYNTFDSALGSRTARDVNLAFAAACGMKDIPGIYIHHTVSADAYLRYGPDGLSKIPPAEKAEGILDRKGFINWLMEISPGSQTSQSKERSHVHVLRAPVVTAMMATYNKGPNNANEFWRAVREETAARDDPTRVLARFLVRVSIRGGNKQSSGDKKIVTFKETYVKCLHAWNAWRKGESTSLQYHAQKPVPSIVK